MTQKQLKQFVRFWNTANGFKNGEVDEVNLVYTEFISALSQEPKIVKLLPVTIDNTNTEKEVKEVGKLFGQSQMMLGIDANEEKLKAEDLTARKYVLFSTHGILGNEIPYIKQPALVLSLVGNDKEDGFLTAAEIFNMNMNADIVGLSACKTGLGVQSAGEGVVGLSRAFMYAGTDTVLVSLWSVSDESTYKLMVNFFDGLKRGKDKLTALKDAKNRLRASGYENPFYWAPSILVGEAN